MWERCGGTSSTREEPTKQESSKASIALRLKAAASRDPQGNQVIGYSQNNHISNYEHLLNKVYVYLGLVGPDNLVLITSAIKTVSIAILVQD